MERTKLHLRGRCYVYIWFYPDGRPLYVGKGTYREVGPQRWEDHVRWPSQANQVLAGVYRKAGGSLPIVIVREQISEGQAFELEAALIIALGRKDLGTGSLCNHTDGVDGGANPSPLTRARMSAAGLGRPKSPEHRQRIGEGHRGKPKPKSILNLPPPEASSIYLQAYHARMTPEQKAQRAHNISLATRVAMAADPTISERISASRLGKPLSQETKQKAGAAIRLKRQTDPAFHSAVVASLATSSRFRGRMHTSQTRAKMRASQQARLAARRAEAAL